MTRVKGFTLVELMVVVALLAIVATIAMPNFSTLIRDNRTESQAEELNALLQYARSEAVIRKTPITVTISTTNGTVEIKDASTLLRSSTINLGQSTLAASAASLAYHPNGTANTPDFKALLCSSDGASSGRLLTVSASGATRLHPRGKNANGTALGGCSV